MEDLEKILRDFGYEENATDIKVLRESSSTKNLLNSINRDNVSVSEVMRQMDALELNVRIDDIVRLYSFVLGDKCYYAFTLHPLELFASDELLNLIKKDC